jgi:HlyD family secretion protein
MQTVNAASTTSGGGSNAAADKTTQGVFLLKTHGSKLESQFVPVTTGITGSTDIEVTSGLKPGDELVIGPYKVLRTLKNDVKLKRDNAAAATQNTESS